MAKQFLMVRALAAPAVMLCTVGQGVFGGLQDMKTPLGITLIGQRHQSQPGRDPHPGARVGACEARRVQRQSPSGLAASSYLYCLWSRRDSLGGPAAPEAMKRMTPGELASLVHAVFQRGRGRAHADRAAARHQDHGVGDGRAAGLHFAIASHQVVMLALAAHVSMLVDSLAVSGQSMVAVEFGKAKLDCLRNLDADPADANEKGGGRLDVVNMDSSGARRVADRLLQLGVGSGIVLAGIFVISYPVLPKLFTDDAQVTESINSILPIALAMLPVNGAVYVLDGILVGSRDFKWMAMAMSLAAGCVVALLAAVEPLDLGLPGVWYALAGLMLLRMTTLVWRYQSSSGPFSKNGIQLDLNVLGSMDSYDAGSDAIAEIEEDASSNIILVDKRRSPAAKRDA